MRVYGGSWVRRASGKLPRRSLVCLGGLLSLSVLSLVSSVGLVSLEFCAGGVSVSLVSVVLGVAGAGVWCISVVVLLVCICTMSCFCIFVICSSMVCCEL